MESTRSQEAAAGGNGKRDYVRSVFQQIAPSYDLLNHLLSFNIDRRWRRRAIATLAWPSRASGTYLDLCAGTMDVSAALSGMRGFDGRVVAVDFAEAMLRAGQHKSARRPIAPVVGDALSLPLPDESISGAIVAFGARNFADLDRGLREVFRVLQPGARLVILEFATPSSWIVRMLYHAYFHRVLPLIGGAISGHRTAYRYLPTSVEHFPKEAELSRRLAAAGFAEIAVERLSLGIAAIHGAIRPGRDA